MTLSKGATALIDAQDREIAEGYSWFLQASGYAATSMGWKGEKTLVYLHRLLSGAPDDRQVDHINGDKLDNRRANLRIVTQSENMENRHAPVNSKTGVRNVWYSPRPSRRKNPYSVLIKVRHKRIYLGVFATLEEAAAAASEGRRRYMTHAADCGAEA